MKAHTMSKANRLEVILFLIAKCTLPADVYQDKWKRK